MVHGGVTHHDRFHNLRRLGVGLVAHLCDRLIQRLDDQFLHEDRLRWCSLGVGHAGNNILAIGDLRIHDTL